MGALISEVVALRSELIKQEIHNLVFVQVILSAKLFTT
jgi:hypothetical protein